jgi:hypothetical protein
MIALAVSLSGKHEVSGDIVKKVHGKSHTAIQIASVKLALCRAMDGMPPSPPCPHSIVSIVLSIVVLNTRAEQISGTVNMIACGHPQAPGVGAKNRLMPVMVPALNDPAHVTVMPFMLAIERLCDKLQEEDRVRAVNCGSGQGGGYDQRSIVFMFSHLARKYMDDPESLDLGSTKGIAETMPAWCLFGAIKVIFAVCLGKLVTPFLFCSFSD